MKFDPPYLFRGALSGKVYVATHGKHRSNGIVEASVKYDVTEQFDGLANAELLDRYCEALEQARLDLLDAAERMHEDRPQGSFTERELRQAAGAASAALSRNDQTEDS